MGHNQTLYCLPINLKEFRSVVNIKKLVLKPKLDPFYQLNIKKSGLLPGRNSRLNPEKSDRDASFPAQPEFTSKQRIKTSENPQTLKINSEIKPEIVDSTSVAEEFSYIS